MGARGIESGNGSIQARATGELASMLSFHGAPENVQDQIARRAGNLVGTGIFPLAKIERAIDESRRVNKGMPEWDVVTQRIGSQITDRYQRMRRNQPIR